MKQYELLAPAGDFSCLTAAFHAGADAVYLAGKSFGARAFAGNFTTEELVEALDYAHLFSKKIYLTLNTLIKEKEFGSIAGYLTPFYEHGLDGVIIQDPGLIPYFKREFPLLELHASTQMTVSNYRSALWLKEQGILRVVPARELSLKELREIKEKAGVEVETFIHGAMCYCYSGQCLFSSFLGGRSGNRGRCAQPCRLPYKVWEKGHCISGKKEVYPLSLKDLCSLPYLYELMDAGMDSFKIEGRMKSPEYVAGVTEVYRKYMDFYMQGKRPEIAKKDLDQLAHLYIRSDMKDGYLKKHNGSDMISLYSPSYQGCDDAFVERIHQKYCTDRKKQDISGSLLLLQGQPSQFTVTLHAQSVTVTGDEVQCAQKRPLTKEDVLRQMQKTGHSDFVLKDLEITMDEQVFMPVRQLNELRRSALAALQDKLLASYKRDRILKDEEVTDGETSYTHYEEKDSHPESRLFASVMTYEQLESLLSLPQKPDRIYVPYDLLYLGVIKKEEIAKITHTEVYLSLPRMLRSRDEAYLQKLSKELVGFQGILVKSMEGLAFLQECDYTGVIVTDHSVYHWNKSAVCFWDAHRDGFTYPLELSIHENRELERKNGEYVIYGRTPMMITANCIRQTCGACSANSNDFSQSLEDRYKKKLPVYANCIHCYNEVFNAVPMSLHKELDSLNRQGFFTFRLDFTNEEADLTKTIFSYFTERLQRPRTNVSFPLSEYTQGHYKEGAI